MCGLFGVVRYGKQPNVLVRGLVEKLAESSEFRGTDAGGIAYVSGGQLMISKSHNAISKNGSLETPFERSRVIMGHTRMTTQGDHKNNENNHPFYNGTQTVAMAHNGVLTNDDKLAVDYVLPDTTIDTDSYVVTRLMDMIRPDGYIDFSVIRQAVEKIGGTFNFTFLDNHNNLWIARHNNPLYVLKLNDFGLIAYASTEEIMIDALNNFLEPDIITYLLSRVGELPFSEEISTKSGEIIKITPNGDIERECFKPLPYTPYTYYTAPSKYYDKYADWYNEEFKDAVERSVDKAVIYNGYEVELVNNFNNNGDAWSQYLGKFIHFSDKGVHLMEEYDFIPDYISKERIVKSFLYDERVATIIESAIPKDKEFSVKYGFDIEDTERLVQMLTLRYVYNNGIQESDDIGSLGIKKFTNMELTFMKKEMIDLSFDEFLAIWIDFYFYESWAREVDKKYA